MRFILIDEIVDMVPGQSIHGTKFVSPDEDFFRDHFPGFPVVPGVLLTEMMAQTAGKCLDAEDPARGKSMLAKINGASFRGWVRPGQTCAIHATVIKSRPSFATANCRVEVERQVVCTAELFFSFVAQDSFAPGYRDEVLESFLKSRSDNPKVES